MARKGYIDKLAIKVLQTATQQSKGNMSGLGGTLLGGDPGIGKTTFVKLFSQLVGIHLVAIEVPHIVEEHIINIPFLVFNPANGSQQAGRSELHDKNPNNSDEYDMVLADSNLFTQITRGQNIPDDQYLAKMNDPHPNDADDRVVQMLFKKLGGTETTIPRKIQQVRQSFNCLLFFDEFYRETPTRIRNILRDTLNGNLGIHKIPGGTFIMYASNMEDEGLSDIQQNQQMKEVEFKAPTEEEWFEYIVAKFNNDKHVQMKPEVLKAFRGVINDASISHNDPSSNVRTSPRRWEQLLIYVNQSLPCEDREDALALLTNVKNNFVNYETNDYSELSKKTMAAVIKLIKASGISDVTETDNLAGHDWDKALEHHIKQHMKSGKHRKYIPVVSGSPGVGKTQQIYGIARKHNLVLVAIDTAKLNAEDVIGMPIPGQRSENNKRMNVKFTVPQLYQMIMREIEDDTKEYFNTVAEQQGEDAAHERLAKWENQEWKYLIFFDELNRADKKTFNSLRRVILEKNFGPESDGKGGTLRLPDGSVVVGAINPSPDTGGTESMTGHFRDVIDVINALPSWSKTRSYLLNRPNTGLASETIETSLMVLDEFAKKFKSRRDDLDDEMAPYFVAAGESEIYISPREYTLMFADLAAALDDAREEILGEDMDPAEATELLGEEIAEALGDTVRFPARKNQQVAVEEFIGLVQEWAETLGKKAHKHLISKSVEHGRSWSSALDPYMKGTRGVTAMFNDSNINTMMDSTNAAQFVEDVSSALASSLKSKEQFESMVLDDTHPRVTLVDDAIATDESEHTHRLGNVIMGLLFTLQLHEYQFDRIIAIGKALYRGSKQAMQKVTGLDEEQRDDATGALIELRNDIHDAIQEIKKNEAS